MNDLTRAAIGGSSIADESEGKAFLYVAIFAFVLAALAFAGTMDYADELLRDALEKEARAQRIKQAIAEKNANHYALILAHCLNGNSIETKDFEITCRRKAK